MYMHNRLCMYMHISPLSTKSINGRNDGGGDMTVTEHNN